MPRIEERIEIAANRADVFRFCHDVAHRPEWDEQVAQVELLSPRPVRAGALLRFDAKGGAVFTWDAEYIEYHIPQNSKLRVIDAASSSPFAKGSLVSWNFEAVGVSTRLTWVWEYKPNGLIARLLDVLGRRSATQRAIKRSLLNLKKVIESGGRAGWQA
jgi:uncharacterized membrane protein